MFGHNSIFDLLEERVDSEGEEVVDRFVFKFYQVLDESDKRGFNGPTSLYSDIQDSLSEYADDRVDVEYLRQVEDQYFGTGNFVSYDISDCFDEAVRETYEELGISRTNQ